MTPTRKVPASPRGGWEAGSKSDTIYMLYGFILTIYLMRCSLNLVNAIYLTGCFRHGTRALFSFIGHVLSRPRR